jgi:hypothetical protein
MGMRLDEAGQQQGASGILDYRARSFDCRAELRDAAVADQHVGRGASHRTAIPDDQISGHG